MKNLIRVSNHDDYSKTNNRTYYNKLRKDYLGKNIEINCSHCKYNKGENYKGKHYGGWEYVEENKRQITLPNWKLVSKNEKQWMIKKTLVIKELEKQHFKNKIYLRVFF